MRTLKVIYDPKDGQPTGSVAIGRPYPDEQVAEIRAKGLEVYQKDYLDNEEIPSEIAEKMWINPLTKRLENCPIKAQKIAAREIDAELAALDVKSIRAIEDFILSGDRSRLEQIVAEKEILRTERAQL